MCNFCDGKVKLKQCEVIVEGKEAIRNIVNGKLEFRPYFTKTQIPLNYCPMCRKEVITMQIGQYIKLILQKKNMTQQDLVNKLNELHFSAKGGTISKNNISNILNGNLPLHYTMARRIEIALELPEYSLVEIVGFPTTEFGKKELEEIGKWKKD